MEQYSMIIMLIVYVLLFVLLIKLCLYFGKRIIRWIITQYKTYNDWKGER